MTRPAPKFAVGEPVRVVPIEAGHEPFDAVVIERRYYGSIISPVWAYWTDPDPSDKPDRPWRECVLRKRPPPADSDYHTLIEKVNCDEPAPADAV